MYTALGLRVATDIGLTAALIYYLQKSRTGFKRYAFPMRIHAASHRYSCSTDTMIDVLIKYAVNTGVSPVSASQ